MSSKLIIFLILNFFALYIGSLFTSKGVPSVWYQNLNKAPWTPPGWFFGFAWTTIMICFAIYMMYTWEITTNKFGLIFLFSLQWLLNILWNPVFFKFHQMRLALVVIIFLTVLIGYFIISYKTELGFKTWWIVPYFVWLLVATSLNGYTVLKN